MNKKLNFLKKIIQTWKWGSMTFITWKQTTLTCGSGIMNNLWWVKVFNQTAKDGVLDGLSHIVY